MSGPARIMMAMCSPITVAQGFGSLGLMTSVLLTPDGKTRRSGGGARHCHAPLPRASKGQRHLDQPDRLHLRLEPGGLKYRGKFDGTPDVEQFGESLEEVCIDTVESGQMTKDLAILIGPEQGWLTTQQFLEAIDRNLQKKLA